MKNTHFILDDGYLPIPVYIKDGKILSKYRYGYYSEKTFPKSALYETYQDAVMAKADYLRSKISLLQEQIEFLEGAVQSGRATVMMGNRYGSLSEIPKYNPPEPPPKSTYLKTLVVGMKSWWKMVKGGQLKHDCLVKVLDTLHPELSEDVQKKAWKLRRRIPFYSVKIEFDETRKRYLKV